MKNQYSQEKKIFLFLFLCLINSLIFAQDCKDILQRAEVAYKKGHLNDVKEILNQECIDVLPSNEDKEKAYYLVTLSNLYLKDVEAAKESMLKILHQNPEYICDPISPVAFQKFYNSFKTTPFIVLGAKAGGNFSQIKSEKVYSLDDSKTAQEGTYTSSVGLNIQVFVKLPIYKRIELRLEAGFKQINYSFKNRQFGYSTIKFTEKQSVIEIPIIVKYNFGNNYNFKRRSKNILQSLNPYVVGGISTTYLLASKGNIFREDKLLTNGLSTLTSPDYNLKSMRNTFAVYGVGGIGIEFKKNRSIFTLECRYNYGFTPIIKSSARYDNQDMLLSYGYIDSDIKFRNIMITAGYAIPLYRPKQIRQFFADEITDKK